MCNYAVLVIWRVVAITIAIINLYLCVFIGLSFGDDNKRRESVNIDCSSPLRSVSDSNINYVGPKFIDQRSLVRFRQR